MSDLAMAMDGTNAPADKVRLPIVLLPGIDGTAEVREGFVARLKRDRDVNFIAYPADAPADYHALYDYILPKLPQGRFVLIGESYSGPMATLLAAQLKDRVAGLILAVTFIKPPLPAPFRALTRWLGTGMLPLGVTDWILMNSATGPVREALHRVIAAVPEKVITARALAALSADMRVELASVVCPVLALEAKHDRLVLGHCSRGIADAKPERRLVLINGPHMILELNVEDCVQVIERFAQIAETRA